MKLKCPLAALAASIALIGCDQPKQSNTSETTAPGTASTTESVKKEIKDAATATKNFLVEGKDQFVAATEKKLNELDQNIATLGQKAEGSDPAAKAEGTRMVELVREKRTQVSAKFDELKKATQETWTDVKAGFESAMSDLQKSFDDAKAKLGG